MALARQPTPCWVWRSHMMAKQYKAGIGWEDSPDIMKAFTRRCVWDESNLATYRILVLNLATVDVPGVIISLLWRPCKHGLYLFGHNIIVYIGLPKVVQAKSRIAKFAWAFCWGIGYFAWWSDYSYRRGLWRCLFIYDRQLLEPQEVERTTDVSTLFCVLNGVLSRTK